MRVDVRRSVTATIVRPYSCIIADYRVIRFAAFGPYSIPGRCTKSLNSFSFKQLCYGGHWNTMTMLSGGEWMKKTRKPSRKVAPTTSASYSAHRKITHLLSLIYRFKFRSHFPCHLFLALVTPRSAIQAIAELSWPWPWPWTLNLTYISSKWTGMPNIVCHGRLACRL